MTDRPLLSLEEYEEIKKGGKLVIQKISVEIHRVSNNLMVVTSDTFALPEDGNDQRIEVGDSIFFTFDKMIIHKKDGRTFISPEAHKDILTQKGLL